jgi:ribonuclease-3
VNRFISKISELFSPRGTKFFSSIKTLTGCSPRSVSVYKLAFIHKSVQQKSPTGEIISNERLEFLGDAILGAVIAHELYKLFPQKDEGALTKMRSRIVNRTLLNQVGLKLGLDKLIQSQPQLELSQTHILGDAVEALIGAVFIDHGFEKAKEFIIAKIIQPHFNIFEIALTDSNYKSLLIEWGHKNKKHIEFKTEEVNSGPENPILFFSRVYIDHEEFGDGSGTSKKESQQNAARLTFKRLAEPDAQKFNNTDLN